MKKIIQLLVLILFFSSSIQAQSFFNGNILLNGNNSDNIYKNSSDSSDSYASIKAVLNFYPAQFLQLNGTTEFTNYRKNNNLSNLKYGGGFTILPLSDSSAFSLYFNFNYEATKYNDFTADGSTEDAVTAEFSDKNINGIFSIGYQLNEKINIRTGYNYSSTGYASDSDFVSDNNINEIFTGLNLSLLGSNALDIEGGYSFSKYDYLPEFDTLGYHYGLVGNRNAYNFLKESDLNSYYISTRYSRPIGQKTGFSIGFSYKEFIDIQDDALVLGSSTGKLSPWLNSYEGNVTLVKIKTYLIPLSIVNFGVGYWNSSYLKTLEAVMSSNIFLPGLETHTINGAQRNDDKYRLFINIAMPIVTSSGRLFEPSLSLDYTDNKSSIENYTYTDFSIILSLSIK